MKRRSYSLVMFLYCCAAALVNVAGSAQAQDYKAHCGADSGSICFTGGDLWLNSGTALATAAASLTMQSDGNLALYDNNGQGRWAAGTFDYPGAYAGFTSDGNLAVYWGQRTLFSSGTAGRGAYLALRRDGNLVIFDANHKAIWSVFPIR